MRVLIADDETISRQLLAMLVERLGHECSLAASGEEAWELYERSQPDMLITDWMMPGLEGPELCRRIRGSGRSGYTYVIVQTSLEGHEHVLTAMRAGADDFLVKPVQPEQLEARLVAAGRVTELHRQLARREDELAGLNQELAAEARTDALTRIGNRLRMGEDLEVLQARVMRYGYSYSVALCDIDRFKLYNDFEGHLAGDEVLKRVAQTLDRVKRTGDSVYRFGGEELLVLLPEQTTDSASIGLERMRAAIEALAITHLGNEPANVVTISAGIAHQPAHSTASIDTVLKLADAALYKAKDSGRNCVLTVDQRLRDVVFDAMVDWGEAVPARDVE